MQPERRRSHRAEVDGEGPSGVVRGLAPVSVRDLSPGGLRLSLGHALETGAVYPLTLFLRGRNREVRELLEKRMAEFSDRMEFEKAALVRDRIAALDETMVGQNTTRHGGGDRDVVAVASDFEEPDERVPRLDINDPAAVADFVVSL